MVGVLKKDSKAGFIYFEGVECEYSLFLFGKENWLRKL